MRGMNEPNANYPAALAEIATEPLSEPYGVTLRRAQDAFVKLAANADAGLVSEYIAARHALDRALFKEAYAAGLAKR
jgi:hypothetical protein